MPSPSAKTNRISQACWRILQRATGPVRGKGLATRFPILWKIQSSIRRSLGVQRVTVLGHDFEVDANDTLKIAARGEYEPDETAWYLANVSAGQVVLEVGGNIGYFTLQFARLVGPDGMVRVYEPDPEVAAILRRNVERNGYQNVVLRQAAAGAETETRQLHYSADNRGDNRFFELEGDTDAVDVEVTSLDDDLAEFTRPIDLMKMDIQGFEPIALAGMKNVLMTNPPRTILMEFWPDGILGNGHQPDGVLATLRGAGYDLFELVGAREEPVDDAELVKRFTAGDRQWVNLVCRHRLR